MRGMDIRQLVADFTERLHTAVDQISVARAREAVMHALGEKRGRLPRGMAAILGRKPRRKAPVQLCPVPGCKNAAAPVFGMVCAEHKNVSKAKIERYREARRAAKQGARPGRAAPRAKSAAKPVETKPVKTKPVRTNPVKAKPGRARSVKAKAGKARPIRPKQGKAAKRPSAPRAAGGRGQARAVSREPRPAAAPPIEPARPRSPAAAPSPLPVAMASDPAGAAP